jgi:hypothetical protein
MISRADRLPTVHVRDRNLSELSELYSAWESWCADVLETRSNYPILAGFQSPATPVSWPYVLRGPRPRAHSVMWQVQAFNGRGGFRTCDLSRVKRALSH